MHVRDGDLRPVPVPPNPLTAHAPTGGRRQAKLRAGEAQSIEVQAESPRPAAATRRSLRLPPSASAVVRAPDTSNASKCVLTDREGDNGDRRPPATTTWRETEFATSRPRWTPRTIVSSGLMRRAADRAEVRVLAIGCTAPARSTVTLTVPGRRRLEPERRLDDLGTGFRLRDQLRVVPRWHRVDRIGLVGAGRMLVEEQAHERDPVHTVGQAVMSPEIQSDATICKTLDQRCVPRRQLWIEWRPIHQRDEIEDLS